MRSLKEQIDLLREQETLAEYSRDTLSQLNRTPNVSAADYKSVGELIRDRLDAPADPQAAAPYEKTMQRAAKHMGTRAPNTLATAGGMPGLIIKQNVGPVIDLSPQGRPLLAALGVAQSVSPISFQRPRLTDDHFS